MPPKGGAPLAMSAFVHWIARHGGIVSRRALARPWGTNVETPVPADAGAQFGELQSARIMNNDI
jgi:hypothetical protein